MPGLEYLSYNYFGFENVRGPRYVVHPDERINDVGAIFGRYIVDGVSSYTGSVNGPIAEVADDFRTI